MKKIIVLFVLTLISINSLYAESICNFFKLKNKTVDFHAHPVTQEFRDGIKTLKIDVIKEDGFPMPEWSVEAHKEFMAEAKIDYTVLADRGMMEPVDIHEEFKNLYFDIAGDPEPVALDILLMVTDVDHVVYGSDFPYVAGKSVIAKKRHFENNEKYKPLIESIYRKNAVKLLENK